MKAYLDKSDAKFFYFVSRETLNPEAQAAIAHDLL